MRLASRVRLLSRRPSHSNYRFPIPKSIPVSVSKKGCSLPLSLRSSQRRLRLSSCAASVSTRVVFVERRLWPQLEIRVNGTLGVTSYKKMDITRAPIKCWRPGYQNTIPITVDLIPITLTRYHQESEYRSVYLGTGALTSRRNRRYRIVNVQGVDTSVTALGRSAAYSCYPTISL